MVSMIKTQDEIAKLRRAAQLGENCFDYICQVLKPGMTERKVAQLVDDFFMKHGASALSFETIVGSGENSCQIHSTPSDRVILEKDIILFDMGCVLDGYCSDMSRTIFVGNPSEKQKELYHLVYQAYQNAIHKITTDLSGAEADSFGRRLIQQKGYDYAHALGHGVGTEVHEKPILSPKSEDILKENMVFSIEPGIYLENEFGIRIEDVGVLTSEGMEMFSSPSDQIVII